MVRFGGKSVKEQLPRHGQATGAAIWLGLAGGLIIAVGAWLAGTRLRGPLVMLALCLWGLLLQDSWRYAFFTSGRSGRAILNDLSWSVLVLGGLWFLEISSSISATSVTFVWGLSGCVAGLLGGLQARCWPKPKLALQWWRDQRGIGTPFLGEIVVSVGSLHAAYLAITGIAGFAAMGAIRGAQLALGPIQVLFVGLTSIAIPEGGAIKQDFKELRKLVNRVTGLLAGGTIVWGTAISMMPEQIGRFFLGETWPAAHSLLIPITIYMLGIALTNGSYVGLRAIEATGKSLRSRLVASALVLAGAGFGALVGGAKGAAFGLGLAANLGAVYWRTSLAAAMRKRNAPTSSDKIVPSI